MPRNRLYPELKPGAYSFHCKITGTVPQSVWNVAKGMQQLWNALCSAHKEGRDALLKPYFVPPMGCSDFSQLTKEQRKLWYEAEIAASKQVAKEEWATFYQRFIDGQVEYAALPDGKPDKTQKTTLIASKETTAYLTTRDFIAKKVDRAGNVIGEFALPVWCKWEVYERFKATLKRWRAKQSGMPRCQYRLDTIAIPYRTQSGGVSLSWLWRQSDAKPVWIRPVQADYQRQDAEARLNWGTRGYFDVLNERLPLEITLHRAVPPGAILKRVTLCGKNLGALGWEWSILLTVNEEPKSKRIVAAQRVAGIDFGWRNMGDRLRYGMVWDGVQAEELALSFNLASRSDRRLQARLQSRGVTCELTRDLRGVWEMQGKLDAHKDECKLTLKQLDRTLWPKVAQQLFAGYARLGFGGLRRLHWLLQTASGCEEPFAILDAWLARHVQLSKRIRKAQLDFLRTRNHLYRNKADELARRFDVICWEGDLDLKKLAEQNSGEYAIEEAKKFKQIVGLYLFKLYLKQAMAKYGKKLIAGKAAYSTTRHYSGDVVAEASADLYLHYSSGHLEDQDVNAARNLWQQIPEDLRAVPGFETSDNRSQFLPQSKAISA